MVDQNQKPNSLQNSIYHAIFKKKKKDEGMTQNYSVFSAVFLIKLPKCNLNKRKLLKINKSSITF